MPNSAMGKANRTHADKDKGRKEVNGKNFCVARYLTLYPFVMCLPRWPASVSLSVWAHLTGGSGGPCSLCLASAALLRSLTQLLCSALLWSHFYRWQNTLNKPFSNAIPLDLTSHLNLSVLALFASFLNASCVFSHALFLVLPHFCCPNQ